MNIYTITCHRAYNYGAVLQTYALQHYLESIGHSVEVIDYKPIYLRKISEKNRKNIFLGLIRSILYYPDYSKSKAVFDKFLAQRIKLTAETFISKEEIEKLPVGDLYIAGSDQIWNFILENGRDDCYFLNFKNITKRVSYAASIGLNYISDEHKQRYKKLLDEFDLISVREKESVSTLRTLGIEARKVLDPVFLLTKEQWLEIVQLYKGDKPYIFVYILHHKEYVYKYAKQLAEAQNFGLIVASVELKERKYPCDKFYWNPKVEQFLGLINGAQAVVTNSFHGVAFSTIFEKEVHIFDTEENDIRIYDFVNCTGLQKHVISESNKLIAEKMNYGEINAVLELQIKESKHVLNDIIKLAEVKNG